jgi:hypothetical protein
MKHAKNPGAGGMATAAGKAKTPAGKNTRQPRKTRPGAKVDQLVCRYCGSDDLAPSFIKRRDARCRACFKHRYGSAAPPKAKTNRAA